MTRSILIIGGGAAGIFGAIAAASCDSSAKVVVLEATDQPLDKVRISGGGRCNVTHNCFDPAELIKAYPRGSRELRSIFSRFQPRDTLAWFESQGVQLKAEPDGRIFPLTDNSATIVDCLLETARSMRVVINRQCRVKQIETRIDANGERTFDISLHSGESISGNRLLIATGSSPQGYKFAESLGHSIVPCVPSLFTFKVSDKRLEELSGISFESVEATLTDGGRKFQQSGPMLITHWGLSGPAILKLSAFAARELAECGYKGSLTIDLLPDLSRDAIAKLLSGSRDNYGRKQVHVDSPLPIPKRYWGRTTQHLGIPTETTWSGIKKAEIDAIVNELKAARFDVAGKGIFKEEFVTCGGVNLKEVDFKTMQSKLCPGLFFAGEILDIDGLTGGFNLQAAWSTGWVAGVAMPT